MTCVIAVGQDQSDFTASFFPREPPEITVKMLTRKLLGLPEFRGSDSKKSHTYG